MDEPSAPPRLRTVQRLAESAAVLVGLAAVLWFFGVGGWRGGLLICSALLGAGGGGAAWLRLRRHPARTSWTAVAAVVGLIFAGLVVTHSPYSAGRLREEMDRLGLPFYKTVDTSASGHSWCRPHCPTVTRVYRGPDISNRAVMLTVAAALYRVGLIRQPEALRNIRDVDRFALLDSPRVTVNVQVLPRGANPVGPRKVLITYAAKRP